MANILISLGKEPDNSEFKVEQSMLKNIEKAIPGPVLNPPKNICLNQLYLEFLVIWTNWSIS